MKIVQRYKKIMEPANLIRKISVKSTLLGFNVGQTHTFRHTQVPYTTLYPTVKRLEKSTDMRFEVTIKGVPDGTRVTRIR